MGLQAPGIYLAPFYLGWCYMCVLSCLGFVLGVCLCVCMHTLYIGGRCPCLVSLKIVPHPNFWDKTLWSLELTNSASLASQQVPGTFSCCRPSGEITVVHCSTWLVHGIETGALLCTVSG